MKYELPKGVSIKSEALPEKYTKETKLTFIDEEFGEFISYVKALQDAGASTHPKAVIKRREATMLVRYGAKNISNVPGTREKAADTMEKKYGVRAALKKKEFLDKSRTTLKQNFGVEHPMESRKLRDKQKTTVQNRYGASNVMHVTSFKENLKNTLLKKYGVTNVMDNEDIKQKQKEKILGFYKQRETLNVLPNGKNVSEFCKEKGAVEAIQHANRIFNAYGPSITEEWIEQHKNNKSSLEIKFGQMLPQSVFHNKKISDDVPYRPDFKLKNIYIDLDGLLYHSDKYKDSEYHRKKRMAYSKQGLTLLQFRQDEVVFKAAIVKSICLAKAGLAIYRLFARKLSIKEVSLAEANTFFNRTHLMGEHGSSKAVALIDKEGTIKCCFSYKRKGLGIDISRFSCDIDTIITGGFSRLLSYVVEKERPKFVQSFVDMRYGDGSSLLKCGFIKEGDTLGWKWTDGVLTHNRLRCTANMDERGLSEKEHALELGLFKIYDAGQAKFVKYFNN